MLLSAWLGCWTSRLLFLGLCPGAVGEAASAFAVAFLTTLFPLLLPLLVYDHRRESDLRRLRDEGGAGFLQVALADVSHQEDLVGRMSRETNIVSLAEAAYSVTRFLDPEKREF